MRGTIAARGPSKPHQGGLYLRLVFQPPLDAGLPSFKSLSMNGSAQKTRVRRCHAISSTSKRFTPDPDAHQFRIAERRSRNNPRRGGIELHGMDAVRKVATKSAREMMSEAVREGHEPNDRAFVVTNQQGETVLTFPFKLALK